MQIKHINGNLRQIGSNRLEDKKEPSIFYIQQRKTVGQTGLCKILVSAKRGGANLRALLGGCATHDFRWSTLVTPCLGPAPLDRLHRFHLIASQLHGCKTPSGQNLPFRVPESNSSEFLEADFYTPPVLRGAALFDNLAPAVYKNSVP